MGEDVVEVGDERPVAVVLHDMGRAVHHEVVVLVTQRVLLQHAVHHVLEERDHDVEQEEILRHGKGQVLVAEQLD